MDERERYKRAYRAARAALRKSADYLDSRMSIVVVGVVGVEVVRESRKDAPTLRCYGPLGEVLARTMLGRGVAAVWL